MKAVLSFGFLVMVAALLLFSLQPSAAADPPLFQKGQQYLIAWDCLPEFVSGLVGQQMGQEYNPCYVEIITVQQVRSDGWLVVKQGNSIWTINQARLQGFTSAPVQGQRASR